MVTRNLVERLTSWVGVVAGVLALLAVPAGHAGAVPVNDPSVFLYATRLYDIGTPYPGTPAVFRVNYETCERSLVSDLADSSFGPVVYWDPGQSGLLPGGSGVTMDHWGNAWLASVSLDTTNTIASAVLLRFDATTGWRVRVSDLLDPALGPTVQWSGVGLGPSNEYAPINLIAAERSGTILLLAPNLLRIDPITGTRTLVSDFADASQGPTLSFGVGPFVEPRAVAVEPAGTVLVADRMRLLRVDPATGFRTVLSDFADLSQQTAGAFVTDRVMGVAVRPSGDIGVLVYREPQPVDVSRLPFLCTGDPTTVEGSLLVRVDPASGFRTVITEPVGCDYNPIRAHGPWGGISADETHFFASIYGVAAYITLRVDSVSGIIQGGCPTNLSGEVAFSPSFIVRVPPPNQPPVADAGPDQSAAVGVVVTLSGSASDPDGDPIVAWRWSWQSAPDTSNTLLSGVYTRSPTFTPDVLGDYVLSLEASDLYAWSVYDYVIVHAAQNFPPIAVATADVTSGTVPLSVQFDASQSRDPESGTLTCLWDFGDLTSSTDIHPLHVFTQDGQFSVQLTVTDPLGQTGTDTIQIEVLPPLNHPPLASPTATPASGGAPLTVQFAANASDADGDALTLSWDFGDPASGANNTSTLANPTHTYAAPGTYYAWLTVSDGRASVPASLTIVVSPAIEFNVIKAEIDFKSKKSQLADVEILAELYTATPAPDDAVALYVDGALVFAAPFSQFEPVKKRGVVVPGVYKLKTPHLWVQVDFTEGRLAVDAEKVKLTGYDPTNGVDIEVMLGSATAVDNVRPVDEKGDRHYKHHRRERGRGTSWR